MLLLRKDRINFAATWNKFRSFNFLFLFLLLSGQNKKLSFGSDQFQPFFYLVRLKRSWTFWKRSLKKFSKLIWKFFFSLDEMSVVPTYSRLFRKFEKVTIFVDWLQAHGSSSKLVNITANCRFLWRSSLTWWLLGSHDFVLVTLKWSSWSFQLSSDSAVSLKGATRLKHCWINQVLW